MRMKREKNYQRIVDFAIRGREQYEKRKKQMGSADGGDDLVRSGADRVREAGEHGGGKDIRIFKLYGERSRCDGDDHGNVFGLQSEL